MHDTDLEDRLRTVLRDEADRLPLTVDVGRVQAGLAARQRSSRSRLGLIAAAVGIVAFGLAGIGLIRQPAQSGVGATPSADTSARPGTPFAIDQLEAPLGEVMVDRSTPIRTPAGTGGTVHRETIGSVSPALQHGIAAICLGEGDLELSFGEPDTTDHVYTTSIPCDGVAHDDGLSTDFEGSRNVIVEANEDAAWRVIVTAQGQGGAVLPTQLEVWAQGNDGQSVGEPVVAHEACTEWREDVQYGSSCLGPVWPAITEPVLRLRRGDSVGLDLGTGWILESIDVTAAPIEDVEASVARDRATSLYSGSPGSGRLQVRADLGPGTWILNANLIGADANQRFHADTYVRLEVEE